MRRRSRSFSTVTPGTGTSTTFGVSFRNLSNAGSVGPASRTSSSRRQTAIKGTTQPLADIHEFAGKIKAGKDAQSDDDFVIVARVEAFIAGWGLREVLKRAAAYHEAGADAILVHSALSTPDEVFSFLAEMG